MTKLKKEVTLKSLEIMINEADRNILHSEIEKLTASVDALLFKGFSDKSLTENLSYLTAEVGKCIWLLNRIQTRQILASINYLFVLSQHCYRFLKIFSGDSFSGETESSSRLKNYLANVEMKSYHKFLKAELSRLENESLRKKEYQNEFCDSAEEILEKNSSLAVSSNAYSKD